MFNHAIASRPLLKRVRTDRDLLCRFHRWLANLRALEFDEIQSVSYVPVSHPFVGGPIGTIRLDYLDRVFFVSSVYWTRKLNEFRDYYRVFQLHASLGGTTPEMRARATPPEPITLGHSAWRRHSRGLFRALTAA